MSGQAGRVGRATGRTRRRAAAPGAFAGGGSEPTTRATYRGLLLNGLEPDEAASLTAFLCGVPIGDQRWTIGQVNQLLFYRELHRTGRFGTDDGDPMGLH